MKIFLLGMSLFLCGSANAVTVCTDEKGKKTYTDFDDCSKLNLEHDKTLNYIRTKPKQCSNLAENAGTLNKLADEHGPNGKTRHVGSEAFEIIVRGHAKQIEKQYQKECVRQ